MRRLSQAFSRFFAWCRFIHSKGLAYLLKHAAHATKVLRPLFSFTTMIRATIHDITISTPTSRRTFATRYTPDGHAAVAPGRLVTFSSRHFYRYLSDQSMTPFLAYYYFTPSRRAAPAQALGRAGDDEARFIFRRFCKRCAISAKSRGQAFQALAASAPISSQGRRFISWLLS